jgi:hypothetical protein
MRCQGRNWKECHREALPGRTFCKKHLEELERELDRIAAMPPGCDEYGSLG